MKICFLIADISGKGGTERVTTMIANGLSNRGKKVSIITCKGDGRGSFDLELEIDVYCLNSERRRFSFDRKLSNITKIWRLIKKNKFDVIIAVDVYLYLYLLPVQITRISKCIVWEHFNYYIASMKSSRIARRIAVKLADKIVVLGKKDLENYERHFINTDKILYIYNPVAYRLNDYRNPDTYRIITAGRLCKQKGFDFLIKAWKIIEEDKDIDKRWRLDIYGEGEEKEHLEGLIVKNKLNRIYLKGYTNNLEEEMINSSLFVLSSRYEGFGLVLLEAQAKGLPCISFNCKEGPAEIIDDGVNGFLVNEEDVEALAEKMKILMNSRELRVNFAKKAQKDLQRFALESVLDSWEMLLRDF